jgi:hypothetical protein
MVHKVGKSSMRLSIKDLGQVQNLHILVRRQLRVFNYLEALAAQEAVNFGLISGQSQ